MSRTSTAYSLPDLSWRFCLSYVTSSYVTSTLPLRYLTTDPASVREGGAAPEAANGVTFLRNEPGYAVYAVDGGGAFRFTASISPILSGISRTLAMDPLSGALAWSILEPPDADALPAGADSRQRFAYDADQTATLAPTPSVSN